MTMGPLPRWIMPNKVAVNKTAGDRESLDTENLVVHRCSRNDWSSPLKMTSSWIDAPTPK